MLFSSISFLYYFLAASLIIYFIVPFKFKNLVLLVASLAFYFYGEPVYTLLMLGTAFSSYIHGLLIDHFRGRKLSKVFLWSSVITSVLVLGFFKYSDFFISNVNSIFHTKISLLGLALPIGISFYTFQTLSYTIDVYRGEAKVQKSFIRLATYVALFPQLIAGPIVRYTTVEEELSNRKHSFENSSYGVNRFIIGLGKKVLIADTLYAMATSLHTMKEASVGGMWLYAISISLYTYFDFSGYSDMAIGLGRIFGFHFLENFNYPFISKNVAEFWRRWHISLGSWFRDYVYIPLGGNRVPVLRWMFNILVVWFLTGFWHGADWTFIVWGLYFAVFLVLEKFVLNKFFAKLPRFFSHIYVTIAILISFVIFHGVGMSGAISDLGSMFGTANLPFWSSETTYNLLSYIFVLIIAIIGATPLVKNAILKLKEKANICRVINVLEPVFHVAVLLITTAYFVDGSFSPFLYFRF
ncbi:MAG: MBOAT family protein [Eubacterium sp.]|nr:MBOAT family protein [Eubacterium sp.]